MDTFEKMPCRYDTPNDIQQRLHGTICRYKGEPVYVYYDVPRIRLKHPVTMKILVDEIKEDDPDFDISSPELGYMNFSFLGEKNPKVRVLYVEREPRKRYRQGLCSSHLTYSDITGNSGTLHIPGMAYEHFIKSQGFYDMLVGNYFSLDDVFGALEEEAVMLGDVKIACTQMALSKDTAIEKTRSGVYQVYFKADNVGWVAPGTRTVNVKSSEVGWVISRYLNQFSWKVE
jgi:hypothetical protein